MLNGYSKFHLRPIAQIKGKYVVYIYNKRSCATVSFTQGVDTLAFLSLPRAVVALPGYKPSLVDPEGAGRTLHMEGWQSWLNAAPC